MRLVGDQSPAMNDQFSPDSIVFGPGRDAEFGDGRNAAQSLTSKTKGANAQEVIFCPELAGGMTLDGGAQLVGRNALAVINDSYKTPTAIYKFDFNGTCLGIEAVLDKLLDN
jgi:hypothetical protein